MSVLPSKLLSLNVTNVTPLDNWTVDDGTGDPWLGYPYTWEVTFTVTAQQHSSHLTQSQFFYTGLDIKIGDWISDLATGNAVRIEDIVSNDGQTVVVHVQDVDRYNTFNDPNQQGQGIGGFGQWYAFTLADDGLPILGPMTLQSANLIGNVGWQLDQMSRFRYRNYLRTHYRVQQVGHTFAIGNLLIMKTDGTYAQALPQLSVGSLVGAVTDIGAPGPDWFSYRPVGRVVENLPGLPGSPGALIYIDTDGTLTTMKPTAWAKPVYLRLEVPSKGIVLDRSIETTNMNGYSSQVYVVPNVAARDAIADLNPGDQAFVQNMGDNMWAHFIYELNGTWSLLVTEQASNTDSYSKQVQVGFASASEGQIAIISDGRRVDEVFIEVTTAFDGPATLTVGDINMGISSLMSADQNDLSVVGTYKIDPAFIYNTGGQDTTVEYYLTVSNCTTGAATVSITYS